MHAHMLHIYARMLQHLITASDHAVISDQYFKWTIYYYY